jgi:hypothetical protein
MDSWSARLTVNPRQNWSAQYSIGQLHSPEALVPGENLRRMTASLTYNRRIGSGNWASMVLWGRNRSLSDGNIGNAYLVESTLNFWRANNLWGRVENVDRTNELLLGDGVLPNNFTEQYFARVQAYTVGYDRDLGKIPHVSTAIGGQVSVYGVPAVLMSSYGAHPFGVLLFVRVRLF